MRHKPVVLVEFFLTEDLLRLFIVHAESEKPQVLELPVPVEELRRFVKSHVGMAVGGDAPGLAGDWQSMLEPLADALSSCTTEGDILWLVPHDVLHHLPLHALKLDGGQRYLIDRHPICYTPSAAVMRHCQASRRGGRRQRALVLGDSRGDLRHARQEASTVAKLFGTMPHLQQKACKRLFLERLEQERGALDIVHLACHGRFHPERPLESRILLAPEMPVRAGENTSAWDLTTQEIFSLRMEVDLVTLSACQSGMNELRPGDEMLGFIRALLFAGASSVLLSLWSVQDRSTSLLMRRFYQELRRHLASPGEPMITKVEALQAAQRYVKGLSREQLDAEYQQLDELHGGKYRDLRAMDEQESAPLAHPLHWAPFVLIGDWM